MKAQPTINLDDDFASLLIPHQPDELRRLRADLKAHGLICPLVVWSDNHLLLDGHARLLLCAELGIICHVHTVKLPNRAAAKRWIVSHQLARRNLNHFQREHTASSVHKRLRATDPKGSGPSATDYSRVHKIKRIQKSPRMELVAGVRDGTISVDDAYRAATPQTAIEKIASL